MTSRFQLVPLPLREAQAFHKSLHRHHEPPHRHLFSLGAARDGKIVAVCTVDSPKARMLRNGFTCEVARLTSDGTRNACSFLYGRSWRAAQSLGYKCMVTYTLPEEGGASLRASGWKLIGETGGGSWSRDGRPRVDTHPLQRKFRWEAS